MTPALFFGDAAQVPGAAVLALSFVLLHRLRLDAMLRAYAAQAAVLALGAAWQGAVQGAPQLHLVAAASLAKGVLVPLALRRVVPHPNAARAGRGADRAAGPATGGFAPLVLGAGLVALAAAAVPAPAPAPVREGLVLALSVVLLGLLAAATRRDAPAQAVGLLCAENGLVLALVGVPGMPLAAGLGAASLALAACAAFGACAFETRASASGAGRADTDRGPR